MFHFFERETHNICQRPGKTGYNEIALLLDRVAAGLVEGVHAAQVEFERGVIKGLEGHLAGHALVELEAVPLPSDGQTGEHRVSPAREELEHGPGRVEIAGLVEHGAVDEHRGVRADDGGGGMPGGHPIGLERGVVPDHLARVGVVRLVLGHLGRDDLKRHAQRCQQLLPPG